MRRAFAQVSETDGIYYGIEVPTRYQYRFQTEPGENRVSARHDFVIFETNGTQIDPVGGRANLVEFKEGRPKKKDDCPSISKDFKKLLREPLLNGSVMFHILHAANRGSIPSLLCKYSIALRRARDVVVDGADRIDQPQRWIMLLILIKHVRGAGQNRPALWKYELPQFNVAMINPEFEFQIDRLERIELSTPLV